MQGFIWRPALAAGLGLVAIAFAVPAAAIEELSADKLIVEAEVKKQGDRLEYAFDSIWTMHGFKMLRINPGDMAVTELKLQGAGSYRAMGIGEGALWLADINWGKVFKIDPATNAVALEIPAQMLYVEGSVGVGEGSVFVVTSDGGDKTLTRFNAATGAVEATTALPGVGGYVAVEYGSVWVTGPGSDELYRIDPKTNALVATLKLHDQAKLMCAADGSIWVLSQGDGMVDRIDGKTGTLVATIDSGIRSARGGDLTCGGGYVWAHSTTINDIPALPVVQIDPATNTILRRYSGGRFGWDLRYGGGWLWMTGASVYRVTVPK